MNNSAWLATTTSGINITKAANVYEDPEVANHDDPKIDSITGGTNTTATTTGPNITISSARSQALELPPDDDSILVPSSLQFITWCTIAVAILAVVYRGAMTLKSHQIPVDRYYEFFAEEERAGAQQPCQPSGAPMPQGHDTARYYDFFATEEEIDVARQPRQLIAPPMRPLPIKARRKLHRGMP